MVRTLQSFAIVLSKFSVDFGLWFVWVLLTYQEMVVVHDDQARADLRCSLDGFGVLLRRRPNHPPQWSG